MKRVQHLERYRHIAGEIKIALGVLLAVYVIFNIVKLLSFPELSLRWHLFTSLVGLLMFIAIGLIVRWIDLALDKKYPFERNPFKRIALQFGITLLAIVVVRVVSIPLFLADLPLRPTRELIVAGFAINVFMVLSIVMFIFGYHFFRRWKEGEVLAAELAREKAIVQYENLRNQLNPHFLFNALSSLNSLIFENPQLASDFLLQLSKVYRYVLENKEHSLVPLYKEVNFVKHYISLLEARFDGGIEVHLDITEEEGLLHIVPVTLQILLENAIKHNTTSKNAPLHIYIAAKNGYLTVRNNLQRKSAIENSNGQGLENLKSLYRYLNTKDVIILETAEEFSVGVPLS